MRRFPSVFRPSAWLFLVPAIVVMGCSLSPVHRKIKIGEEAFVVFVATGPDNNVDLFAAHPTGGTPVRLTFTPMVERLPRLTSRGDVLAFIRERDGGGQDLVLMNLLSGAERLLELPAETGRVTRLGWSLPHDAVYVEGSGVRYRVAAPPAPMAVEVVDAGTGSAADSALATLVGEPAFARVERCEDGGVCITGPTGTPVRLTVMGVGAFRWGTDSVAWFEDGTIVVRPLGPGNPRRLSWSGGMREPVEGSYAEP
jgi:hypothetical protein